MIFSLNIFKRKEVNKLQIISFYIFTEYIVQSLGQEDPLEKEMATHSSILAWEIPWTEEPRGLSSMGSQKSWT